MFFCLCPSREKRVVSSRFHGSRGSSLQAGVVPARCSWISTNLIWTYQDSGKELAGEGIWHFRRPGYRRMPEDIVYIWVLEIINLSCNVMIPLACCSVSNQNPASHGDSTSKLSVSHSRAWSQQSGLCRSGCTSPSLYSQGVVVFRLSSPVQVSSGWANTPDMMIAARVTCSYAKK